VDIYIYMATTGTFRYQFDCSNAVNSSTITTYLPITIVNRSITIGIISVTQDPSNTYTIAIPYYISIAQAFILGASGVNFNVNPTVLAYYNNTSGLSGVSNLKILGLDNIPLSSNGSQFANLTTLTQFTSGKQSSATILSSMFSGCSNMTQATFDASFNTSNVTTMAFMFYECTSLSSLDITHFDTTNVTTMASMFYGCSSLTSLPFGSNFNTSKVRSMTGMFNRCSSLSSLDLSNFNTSLVDGTMTSMFANCYSLTSLNGLTSFNTSNVTSMRFMFAGCFALNSLDLTSFNTSKVTNMSYMFSMTDASAIPQDSFLNTITFGENFGTSACTNMANMFYNCKNLTNVQHKEGSNPVSGIDNWNTSNVTNMTSMFENNEQLSTIGDVYTNWNVLNVGSNHANFSLNSLLTNIPNFTDSQIDASGTLFFQQSGSYVQYSTRTDGPWSNAVWPITVTNTDTINALTMTFTTDLSFNALTQYFILDSSNITIDGSKNVVNVNVDSYPGLVKNGTSDTSGNSNITIRNLGVESTYSVAGSGGWIGQSYFGNNATDNLVTNSYSTGPIGGNAGGIFGAESSAAIRNCYSTGSISNNAGGIFGYGSKGSVSNCYSNGDIDANAGGIFGFGSSGSATNCYSRGTIGFSAGGIFGYYSFNSSANNCYSTGTINGGEGIGAFIDVSYCYSTNGASNWLDAYANAALNVSQSNNAWTDIDENSTNVPYRLTSFLNQQTLYNPSGGSNVPSPENPSVLNPTDYTWSITSVNGSTNGQTGISINSSTGDIYFNSLSYNIYAVNVLAVDSFGNYSFETFTNIISNICFPAGTPIVTNQGIIAINKINPAIHTILNKKIVAITKTVSLDKYLVRFEKDALGLNLPCKATVMTKNHRLFYKGNMLPAETFVKTHSKKVHKVAYTGFVLYNVLMEEHNKMVVNNLICETLHPQNYVAKIYKVFNLLTPKRRVEVIKLVNNYDIRKYLCSTFKKPKELHLRWI